MWPCSSPNGWVSKRLPARYRDPMASPARPDDAQSSTTQRAASIDPTDAPHRTDPWYRRVRQRVGRHRLLDLTWRIGVLVVGWGVVAAGVVMLVVPGPGWAAIFIGFAILATEFEWAERLLDRAKAYARRAAQWAKEPRHRRLVQVLTAVTVTVLVAGCWWYVDRYGLPGFVTAALEWFG